MAVAHDAVSESHSGTTGSASEASFTWSHNPVGVPRGILVFTFVNANADDALSVTYDGVNVPAVTGGRAVDTATEAGDCKAWFLGTSITTDPANIVVNRNNNANVMYAVGFTVTALTDTEIYLAGIVLLQDDGTLAEQNVDDGSPGTNSLRYCGLNSGLPSVPALGASSTSFGAVGAIDFTPRVVATCRETNAGQGSRPVGFSSGTSDDRAVVHLAIREVVGGAVIPPPRPTIVRFAATRAATY